MLRKEISTKEKKESTLTKYFHIGHNDLTVTMNKNSPLTVLARMVG